MRWATSILVVFPVGKGAGLRFRGVGVLVIGQFCVRDTEPSGGRMVALGGELPSKPEGTDVRRILIAHAMRYKGDVRNGHKILRGFAAGTAEGEGYSRTAPLVSNPTYCRTTGSLTKVRRFRSETAAAVDLSTS